MPVSPTLYSITQDPGLQSKGMNQRNLLKQRVAAVMAERRQARNQGRTPGSPQPRFARTAGSPAALDALLGRRTTQRKRSTPSRQGLLSQLGEGYRGA